MKHYIFFTLAFFCISETFSQDSEAINTDRPDQSDGSYIVSKETVQVETGILYGKDEAGYIFHNTMVRYGVNNKLEARLLVDYGKTDSNIILNPVGLSIKHQLFEQKKILPAITFVAYGYLPFTATQTVKPDKLPFNFLVAFQNNITKKLGIGYNIGFGSDGNAPAKNWTGTLAFGYEIMRKGSLFTEYYAQYQKGNTPNHNFDMGILYPITNNLQWDVALGTSLFGQTANRFITTGISFRFPHKTK